MPKLTKEQGFITPWEIEEVIMDKKTEYSEYRKRGWSFESLYEERLCLKLLFQELKREKEMY
jgi:hypothetical protein